MDSNRKEHLSCLIDTWVNGNTHPGAVVGMYNAAGEEIFYHEANSPKEGFCEGENAVGYKRDTIFRIYSMTKPITAVAAMILVERGLLSVEDEVAKWIPAFKNTQVYVSGDAENPVMEPVKTPLTIYHLLTHTSGIVYALFGKTVCDQILVKNIGADILSGMRNTPLSELCDMIARTPLKFQPGTGFEYALNLDVLGHIIELASGCKLNDFFHTEIFQPLGMVDTDFYVPADKFHRLAKCYEQAPGLGFKQSLQPVRNELFGEKPINLAGGGGLLSTLADYARFSTCLLNNGAIVGTEKRILSAQSVAKMSSNVLPEGKDIADLTVGPGFLEVEGGGYGFGYAMSVITNPKAAGGGILSGHGEYGWGGFASTFFYVDPVYQVSCVLMTQLTPSNAYPIRSHLRYMSHWALQKQEEKREI